MEKVAVLTSHKEALGGVVLVINCRAWLQSCLTWRLSHYGRGVLGLGGEGGEGGSRVTQHGRGADNTAKVFPTRVNRNR